MTDREFNRLRRKVFCNHVVLRVVPITVGLAIVLLPILQFAFWATTLYMLALVAPRLGRRR